MNTTSKFRVLRVFLQGALPTIAASTSAPKDLWAVIVLVSVCFINGFHAIAQLFATPPPSIKPDASAEPDPK